MRKIMMMLAAIAAVVTMMGASALPAFANDWGNWDWGRHHRCCDDGFIGFNDRFDLDDCGLSCRDDRFFGFRDDRFFGFRDRDCRWDQDLDMNTGQWIWVWKC